MREHYVCQTLGAYVSITSSVRLDDIFSTYFQWLIGRCSLVFGASIMQDRDLNEYSPSSSSTSKHLSCSHSLCELGASCKTAKESCPYNVNYLTENTSTSGLLVEDILHLATAGGPNVSNGSLQAPVIIGYAFYCLISFWSWYEKWYDKSDCRSSINLIMVYFCY